MLGYAEIPIKDRTGAQQVPNDFANELCLELGGSSRPESNIEHCLTVNLNVEENLSKKSRSYASKNC
jgi:hypothetical protein